MIPFHFKIEILAIRDQTVTLGCKGLSQEKLFCFIGKESFLDLYQPLRVVESAGPHTQVPGLVRAAVDVARVFRQHVHVMVDETTEREEFGGLQGTSIEEHGPVEPVICL